MARIKGTKNLNPSSPPETILLSDDERLIFIANLIIDRVFSDENNDFKLLGRLVQSHE